MVIIIQDGGRMLSITLMITKNIADARIERGAVALAAIIHS